MVLSSTHNAALGWISARHLQHFVAKGTAAGFPVADLLAESGLSPAQWADADGQIPLQAMETLLSLVSQRYKDPLLGLYLAADIQPATFGVLGYVFQSCATVADMLDVMLRYNGLLSNIGKVDVVFVPGAVELRWACLAGGEALRRQAAEYVLGATVTVMRLLLTEMEDCPRAIHFSHSRPEKTDRAREYFDFFGCPVYFDCPHSAIILPVNVLKTRLRHGDAFIKNLMEHHARGLLQQRQQGNVLTHDVKHLMEAMILDGIPTKEMLASQLGMSSRSLHRKLQEVGSSYRELLDEVRLKIARQRLLNSQDSLSVIAVQLGFASHQPFLRWFKQTTGKTPGDFRRSEGVEA